MMTKLKVFLKIHTLTCIHVHNWINIQLFAVPKDAGVGGLASALEIRFLF